MKSLIKYSALALLITAPAMAQSAANVTTTSAAPKWTDNMRFTLSADYFGQALTDLASTSMPDATSGVRDTTSPVFVELAAIPGYKVGDWILGGAAVVRYTPVTASDTDSNFVPSDLQLRVTNGTLYSKGAYSLGTQLRIYMGTTDIAAKSKTLIHNLRWYQFQSLELPGSRWSFNLVTILRPYFFSSEPAKPRTNMSYYAGPQVNYQLSENVQAWGLFEYMGSHAQGDPMLKLTPATDLEFGANFTLSKKLTVTPYIDIKTSDRVSLDTTTIQANVTYVAL